MIYVEAMTPLSAFRERGKYHIQLEASHRATDAGNKESPSCGGVKRNKTLREGIPPQWENWQRALCVCGCTRGMCAKTQTLQTCMEGIAFQWFLHSRHSFLWISSQREARCSRALTSWGGSTLPSTFCLPLSHNPTHIWKWEEGNPRWWLKGFCCQGEFSPHLFFCVCVSSINVYITSLSWRSAGNSKCGFNSCVNVCICLEKVAPWVMLSFYL